MMKTLRILLILLSLQFASTCSFGTHTLPKALHTINELLNDSENSAELGRLDKDEIKTKPDSGIKLSDLSLAMTKKKPKVNSNHAKLKMTQSRISKGLLYKLIEKKFKNLLSKKNKH